MVTTHFRMLDSPTDYAPSKTLGALMLHSVNAGLDLLHAQKPVLPMLITAIGDHFDLTIFAELDVEHAYATAITHLTAKESVVDACAFIFPATLQATGWEQSMHVVAVEGSEKGASHGFRLIGVPKDEHSGSAA